MEVKSMNLQATRSTTEKRDSPQRILMDRGVTKLSIGQSRIRITYSTEKNTTAVQAIRSILLDATPF